MQKIGVLASVVGIVVLGCGESEKSTCAAGANQVCPCPGGGTGVQTCADDGSKWGSCTGCSSIKKDSGGTAVCSSGATQSCACPGGGTGVQTCNSSGTAWGTCNGCPKKDSGTTTPEMGSKVICKTQQLHPVGTSFCFDKFDQTGKTKSEAITFCATKGKNGQVCTFNQIVQAVKTLGWSLSNEIGTTAGTNCCCPCGSWPGSPQTFWQPNGKPKCECWAGKGNTHHKTYFRCCTDVQ